MLTNIEYYQHLIYIQGSENTLLKKEIIYKNSIKPKYFIFVPFISS